MTMLTIEELFAPKTNTEWLAELLANGTANGLSTTSWQSGGVARTIFAIGANMFGQQDAYVSVMAQGGFLDFAASGSVTYTAANGEIVTAKVTPDPSVAGENPNGTPGWLDLIASGRSVFRIGARRASGDLAIASTVGVAYGPYSPGTYHVSNPTTGEGFSNRDTLTIGAANIVGGTITGATNATPIVITTSAPHGLTSGDSVLIAGVTGNTAANGFWRVTVGGASSLTLSGSSGNGAYVSGGTVNKCTTGAFEADEAGPEATSTPGAITETVTTLSGVSVYNLDSFVGANWESNTALAARVRLKLQALSPNGPKGAHEYFALTSADLLAAEDPAVELSSPITRAKVAADPVTGIVTTTVASANGAVPGVTNLAVTGATNATPIEITTAAHGLSTGDYVTVSGVTGNTNANGTFQITVTGATTFTLDGSAGNAAYGSGGVVQGGDLGQVDRIIQQNAVPDTTVSLTQSASSFNVAIVGGVTVPQANVAAYSAAVQTMLAAYFATLPIGGIGGFVIYNDIVGILFAAGIVGGAPSYVQTIPTVTLNGGTTDLAYTGPSYVAALSPAPVITVTGV